MIIYLLDLCIVTDRRVIIEGSKTFEINFDKVESISTESSVWSMF